MKKYTLFIGLIFTIAAQAATPTELGRWRAEDASACEEEAESIAELIQAKLGAKVYYRCDRWETGTITPKGECDLSSSDAKATILLTTDAAKTPFLTVLAKKPLRMRDETVCVYKRVLEQFTQSDGSILTKPSLIMETRTWEVQTGDFSTKADCEKELAEELKLPIPPSYFKADCRRGYDAKYYIQTFELSP